jgi:hypothetical protein
VLTDAHYDGITTMDRRGRTPLHFALSNAGRKATPAAVRLLLSLNKKLVNSVNSGPLPLRVLSEFAVTVPRDQNEQRVAVQACLKLLLLAQPNPTADFFTALQSLPDFLREIAVVMKVVQELLNDKIAQRFCSLTLILDFYAQMMVVAFYSITVKDSVDMRFTQPDVPAVVDFRWLLPLYIGASYFLMREVIQILSLLYLGALHIWFYEPSNWLSVIYIFLIYFWTVEMTLGTGDADFFRTGSALSIIVIWTKFLAYLRNMLIDFAVFTGGVFHVMRRLAAFLVCLIIILVAFSRIFVTLFRETPYCGVEEPVYDNYKDDINFINDMQCGTYESHVWCNGWDAFLAVYTMLLGEVDETVFDDNTLAIVFFALFMFLCVILLANVLIAIVTDSYKVIQDQRAAIVFWTNRLDFIAQMDAIANGPWKRLFLKAIGTEDVDIRSSINSDASFGKDFWKRLMDLYEDETDDSLFSLEFICYSVLRLSTALFIIPAWILVGLCTAGWFWPPQIREFIFTSTVSKHNSESEKEDELRKTQLVKLKAEVGTFKDDLLRELALDRTQFLQMKSAVAERKLEIQSEMKYIKRIVAMLFEQQGTM